MKISRKQQRIIDLMKEGWILYSFYKSGESFNKINKSIILKEENGRGRTIEVDVREFDSLRNRNLIKFDHEEYGTDYWKLKEGNNG